MVPLLLGVFVAPIAAVLVYADATRRGRTRSTRLAWTAVVAAVSFGGFLLPTLSGDVLVRTYLQWVKSAPVVTSPLELLTLRVGVGFVATAVALVVYGIEQWR